MSAARGRYLAVVPARGGSKRIPRKNIRSFRGVPLLGRTLQTLNQAALFDAVVVSTDDSEIAEVGSRFGALVPFIRPEELSHDWTPTSPVVVHALKKMERDWGEFDGVCCVYPGAVLMRDYDYRASCQLLDRAAREDAVVAAVSRFSHPIQRSLRRTSSGLLAPKFPQELLHERTQDLEPTWYDAGQFYWASPGRWRSPSPLLKSVVPYEVPGWRVQDIDTEDDWIRAEIVHSLITQEDQRSDGEPSPEFGN